MKKKMDIEDIFPSTMKSLLSMLKDSEIYQGYQYFGSFDGNEFLEDKMNKLPAAPIGCRGYSEPLTVFDVKRKVQEKLRPKPSSKKVFKAIFQIYDENVESQGDISEQERDVYELIEAIINTNPNETYHLEDNVDGYFNIYERFIEPKRKIFQESNEKISHVYEKIHIFLEELEKTEKVKFEYDGYNSDDDGNYKIRIKDKEFMIPSEWSGHYRKGSIHFLFLENSPFHIWLNHHGFMKTEVEKEQNFPSASN